MSEEKKDIHQIEKNWICVITDDQFQNGFSPEQRAEMKSVKAVYDDHELLCLHPEYLMLYKAYKKAQRALEEFKWGKRYGNG